MTEEELGALKARAARASELLENPTFREVTSEIVSGEFVNIRRSATGSVSLREASAANIRAVDAIIAQLEQWIADAAFEEAQAARKVQAAKRR